MIRILDITISLFCVVFLFPLFLIAYFISYFETKSPIFKQQRLGKNKTLFNIYKIRTMRVETKNKPTHLINKNSITFLGKYIRILKIDEIPQIINVLKGEMSFVGPRPNLPSQKELIRERDIKNIYDVKPGITGLSQIKKIDMSKPKLLTESDFKMIHNFNTFVYLKIIYKTVSGKGIGDFIN